MKCLMCDTTSAGTVSRAVEEATKISPGRGTGFLKTISVAKQSISVFIYGGYQHHLSPWRSCTQKCALLVLNRRHSNILKNIIPYMDQKNYVNPCMGTDMWEKG